MKAKDVIIAINAACLLAAANLVASQPTITSFIMNGQAQTGNDPVHRYLRYSVSPGALVYFTVTVSGGQVPLSYQWQLAGTNLPEAWVRPEICPIHQPGLN
jgi:hypothetical protein